MLVKKLVLILSLATAMSASAQTGPSTSGTTVIVPATGEVTHANDEATLTFSVEEHDKDKAAAASRVNRKMKEGMDILRAADPGAELKTQGYYTYPVYPEQPQPPRPVDGVQRAPVPVGWRVGQYVEMKTRNLAALPKTAAAAQKVLAINNLSFGLSKPTQKRLDDQRIAEAYKNLNERIAAMANAMGRKPSDAIFDSIDVDNAGGMVPMAAPGMMYASRAAKGQEQVAEPSFEPGETTLQMRIVGKVKFK
jgi:uncharacterized protein